MTPTPTNTITPTPTFTPTPAIHLADMDGTAEDDANSWVAYVDILVHDEYHAPIANVFVDGNWTEIGYGGSSLIESCTTDATGHCTVVTDKIRDAVSSTTYIVSSLTLSGSVYDSAANHDPDGCELASCDAMTVNQPAVQRLDISRYLAANLVIRVESPVGFPEKSLAKVVKEVAARVPAQSPGQIPAE